MSMDGHATLEGTTPTHRIWPAELRQRQLSCKTSEMQLVYWHCALHRPAVLESRQGSPDYDQPSLTRLARGRCAQPESQRRQT